MAVEALERDWHFIRPGGATRLPRRYLFLDTEATRDTSEGVERQRFACAVTCAVWGEKGDPRQERWMTFDDPTLLWDYVDSFTRKGRRTVLWAHNLGYDVRISDALRELPRLGWRLETHNLSSRSVWLTWVKDEARLDMVDSASVFPHKLATVGKLVGLGKRELPVSADRGVGLFSRCWSDVEILRTAILAYLEWIEEEDLGGFRPTGAAQAWAAFKRKFAPKGLLVHGDTWALRAERRAMWTGRCEAYWHGELNKQVVHEWDFEMAYPRIAQTEDVPVRLVGPMPEDFNWHGALTSKYTTILAECDIETSVPVVPAAHAGNVLWPVGRFRTTLWAPEIKLALDEGAKVHIVQAWLYRKGPALKQWAQWVTEQVRETGQDGPGWKHAVLKYWSRALIGRFAMTHARWEWSYDSPWDRICVIQGWDRTTKTTFQELQIGRDVWENRGQVEWQDSMPMVTGYVQSVCRVWMWRLLRAVPDQATLYCDTDSILVTDQHRVEMETIANEHPEWGLRLKRSWDGFACWGPHQFRTGHMVRVSGIPRTAERVDADHFAGQVWDTLQGSLLRATPDQVVVRPRVWHLSRVDKRRTGPPLGWTSPISLPPDQPP